MFFARGYYPLPPALQTLSLVNCFELGSCPRMALIEGIEHYELCLRAALEEVSQRHTELSSYSFAEDGNFGPSPYRILERHRKEDVAWHRANPDQLRWERKGSPW